MKLYCMAFNEVSVRGHLFYCLANVPGVIHVGHSVYTFFFLPKLFDSPHSLGTSVHKLIRMSIISRLSSRDNHTLLSFAGFIPLA